MDSETCVVRYAGSRHCGPSGGAWRAWKKYRCPSVQKSMPRAAVRRFSQWTRRTTSGAFGSTGSRQVWQMYRVPEVTRVHTRAVGVLSAEARGDLPGSEGNQNPGSHRAPTSVSWNTAWRGATTTRRERS